MGRVQGDKGAMASSTNENGTALRGFDAEDDVIKRRLRLIAAGFRHGMSGTGDCRSSLQTGTANQYCKSVGASKTRLRKATCREELESEKSGVRALFMAADPRIGDYMAEETNATTEQQRPDPNEKLVKVFDSEQESEALVVKGLLDSAGIESDLKSGSFCAGRVSGAGRNDYPGAGRG